MVVALRDLIDLEDTETKPRDIGVRWVLEGVDDGTEMAGEKDGRSGFDELGGFGSDYLRATCP